MPQQPSRPPVLGALESRPARWMSRLHAALVSVRDQDPDSWRSPSPSREEALERGFGEPRVVRVLQPPLVVLRYEERVSPDRQVACSLLERGHLLHTWLQDGGQLVTWPPDARGEAFGSGELRVSVEGTGDLARDLELHREAVAGEVARGREVVRLDDPALRRALDRLHLLHHTDPDTARTTVVVTALAAWAIVALLAAGAALVWGWILG